MEYPKMNPKWKDWWLRALRGGLYEQGTSNLRNKDNTCCCLGVLCDGVDPRQWRLGRFSYKYGDDVRWAECYPPKAIEVKAGISTDVIRTLANMNDNHMSFTQIADWIEVNL